MQKHPGRIVHDQSHARTHPSRDRQKNARSADVDEPDVRQVQVSLLGVPDGAGFDGRGYRSSEDVHRREIDLSAHRDPVAGAPHSQQIGPGCRARYRRTGAARRRNGVRRTVTDPGATWCAPLDADHAAPPSPA